MGNIWVFILGLLVSGIALVAWKLWDQAKVNEKMVELERSYEKLLADKEEEVEAYRLKGAGLVQEASGLRQQLKQAWSLLQCNPELRDIATAKELLSGIVEMAIEIDTRRRTLLTNVASLSDQIKSQQIEIKQLNEDLEQAEIHTRSFTQQPTMKLPAFVTESSLLEMMNTFQQEVEVLFSGDQQVVALFACSLSSTDDQQDLLKTFLKLIVGLVTLVQERRLEAENKLAELNGEYQLLISSNQDLSRQVRVVTAERDVLLDRLAVFEKTVREQNITIDSLNEGAASLQRMIHLLLMFNVLSAQDGLQEIEDSAIADYHSACFDGLPNHTDFAFVVAQGPSGSPNGAALTKVLTPATTKRLTLQEMGEAVSPPMPTDFYLPSADDIDELCAEFIDKKAPPASASSPQGSVSDKDFDRFWQMLDKSAQAYALQLDCDVSSFEGSFNEAWEIFVAMDIGDLRVDKQEAREQVRQITDEFPYADLFVTNSVAFVLSCLLFRVFSLNQKFKTNNQLVWLMAMFVAWTRIQKLAGIPHLLIVVFVQLIGILKGVYVQGVIKEVFLRQDVAFWSELNVLLQKNSDWLVGLQGKADDLVTLLEHEQTQGNFLRVWNRMAIFMLNAKSKQWPLLEDSKELLLLQALVKLGGVG